MNQDIIVKHLLIIQAKQKYVDLQQFSKLKDYLKGYMDEEEVKSI